MAVDRALNTVVFASATSSAAVTPNDSTVLSFKALYIGGAGNVAIKHVDAGTAVTYVGLTAGTVLPVDGGIVMSTNTTATNIVAMDW